MDHTRAVRPPPGARRNLFQGARRQNPTAVRPDTATIFQHPLESEMVERAPNGEYALYAPQTVYKHMALGLSSARDSDEETGASPHINAQVLNGSSDQQQSRRIRSLSCMDESMRSGTRRL